MVPPYTGVPRVSHQFPVLVTVLLTTAVVVLVVLDWTVLEVVIGVWVVVVVEELVDVPVEVAQEVKISDITMRQDTANQVILLDICSSFFTYKIYRIMIKNKTGHTTNPDYSQGSITGRDINHT